MLMYFLEITKITEKRDRYLLQLLRYLDLYVFYVYTYIHTCII